MSRGQNMFVRNISKKFVGNVGERFEALFVIA